MKKAEYIATETSEVSFKVDKVVQYQDNRDFRGHTYLIRSIVYFPKTRRIVSGGYDGDIRIWDLKGDCLKTFENPHKSNVQHLIRWENEEVEEVLLSSGNDGKIHYFVHRNFVFINNEKSKLGEK